METAARPSESATFTAAATIRRRLRPGLGPLPGRSRSPQAASMLAGRPPSLSSSIASPSLELTPSCIVYTIRNSAYAIRRRCRECGRGKEHGKMTDRQAIEATGLEKSYGAVSVLTGVDLRVERGSVFALLGPNGAGKTTTVRILATLTPPDAGQARVAGFDVVRDRHRVRRSISLTGQYAAVDELQTGEENLRMMGRLAGLSRIEARSRAGELLARFDLVEAGRRKVATYSGGMR